MKILRTACRVALLLWAAAPLLATTWYVRPDGGTRYTANARAAQCDGKSDAPYSGHGINQHCAFNDYRYLWDDQHTYGVTRWVISGGDTVILDNRKQWRVGFDQGTTARDVWCFGGNGTFGCINPVIPSGTAAHHTRILGRNYQTCNAGNAPDKTKMTQIFGGYGVGSAVNLSGAQYVDVQCIEITRHSQCVVHGSPAYPVGCHKEWPIDDYDSEGITTDVHTHDLLLQDLWIHGHTDRGIIGPIGGVVTANRVDIDTNGMAGWDFDDGNSTASVNATLNFNYSTIEWSGCNQEYPFVHAIPIVSCYSQSSGGYGDGIGTPAGMGMDVSIDHSIFRYNTQDGEDFGHIDTGSHTLRLTNSLSYANSGGQFKWGPNFTSVLFANNLVLGNCTRMSGPIAGAPSTFNAHLGDFCRAYDAISFNFRQGGVATFAHNTIVSYAPTTFDISCWDQSCSDSTFTFENNIVRGYANARTYPLGGKPGGPGAFYFEKPIGKVVRNNNLYFGLRNFHCLFNGGPNEICEDPAFVGEPRFSREQDLDAFNFNLSPGSPARHAGIPIPAVPSDYSGRPRPATGKTALGALE